MNHFGQVKRNWARQFTIMQKFQQKICNFCSLANLCLCSVALGNSLGYFEWPTLLFLLLLLVCKIKQITDP